MCEYLNLSVGSCIVLILSSVGRGVDVDAVELEVFANTLLEAVPLLDRERVGLRNDWHYVHKAMEVLHKLHIDGTKTVVHRERERDS